MKINSLKDRKKIKKKKKNEFGIFEGCRLFADWDSPGDGFDGYIGLDGGVLFMGAEEEEASGVNAGVAVAVAAKTKRTNKTKKNRQKIKNIYTKAKKDETEQIKKQEKNMVI
jgi:hypothetical protein